MKATQSVWTSISKTFCLETGVGILKMRNTQSGPGPLARLQESLTCWVPCDGYICHQNDHLIGRMTDISIMGKWQVAGVGGTRPLRNVLGKALKGRFSLEARYVSFLSWVMFILKSFSVSRAFVRFGAKRSSSGAFGFDDVLKLFLKLRSVTGHLFANSDYDLELFFENYISFFKAELVFLAWELGWFPGWAKHFDNGLSKLRMKTSLPGVGEIERRRTIDHRRDWYESLAVIHGAKEKNTKKSACDCATSQPFIIYQTSEFWAWRTCFQHQMSLPFCTLLFSCTWMYSFRSVRPPREDSEEKQSPVTFPVLVIEA